MTAPCPDLKTGWQSGREALVHPRVTEAEVRPPSQVPHMAYTSHMPYRREKLK